MSGAAGGVQPIVIGVIVTYLAPETLARCLDALVAQERSVDHVIVVDNAGSDEVAAIASALADRLPLEFVAPGENIGPAGGYALALERALETRFDYAWLMDDDLEPSPSCLAELLRCAEARADDRVLVSPDLFERSTGDRIHAWGWPGVLIPRDYVDRAGVPNADLFWGLEDTEYLHFRPRRVGYHAIRWPAAAADITTVRATSSIAGWKFYYLARNTVALNLYQRPGITVISRMKRLARSLWNLLVGAWADPADRFAKVRFALRGIADGVVNRLGRVVDPTDPDRPLG